jgi:hypothetical protein
MQEVGMTKDLDEEKRLAKKNVEWGIYRNCLLKEGDIYKAEMNLELALEKYLDVFILDYNELSSSEELKAILRQDLPEYSPVAPGLVKLIFHLSRKLFGDNQQLLFDRVLPEHVKVVREVYPAQLPVHVFDVEASLKREIASFSRKFAEEVAEKAKIKDQKEAAKAKIKAIKESEKAEIKAKKEAEKALIKARKLAEKADLKARKLAEKSALKAEKLLSTSEPLPKAG